jgi:hypothetical protein
LGGPVAYRIVQSIAVLVVCIRVLPGDNRAGSVAWLSLILTVAAVLLLTCIVRSLGGRLAGAVTLVLIALSPALVSFSSEEALRLFCLAALMWLLTTGKWRGDGGNMPLPFALAASIALGSYSNHAFLALGPMAAFAWLLQRYVPLDSVRSYRRLVDSLRTRSAEVSIQVLIISIAPLLLLAPWWQHESPSIPSPLKFMLADPRHHLISASRLLLQYLAAPEPFEILLLIASAVTLWWLFVSVQSGSGLPFSFTAVPVTYLVAGALSLETPREYGLAAQPILIANLITFLGLWLRGRANKRVLDSTRD